MIEKIQTITQKDLLRLDADTPCVYTQDVTAEFIELFPGLTLVMADVFCTLKRTQA